MQTLQIGSTLQGGKYIIKKILGQGGFGISYLAEHDLLGTKVAIKEFFMKDFCNREETTSHVSVSTESGREQVARFREKFLKEARNIAKLRHPNIVRISDVFEENDTAYYVMDYCEGGSLSEQVNSHPSGLDEPTALKYIRQVASALSYIHERKMMHLDIKPSNILLDEQNNAVLIDFGSAKQYDAFSGSQTSTTPVGISHGYAPIEQYKQGGVKEFSPATDIYSLGATFYKLITGQTPPEAQVLLEEDLPAFSASQNVVTAIRKAMQVRRADRPQLVSDWTCIFAEATTDAIQSMMEKPSVLEENNSQAIDNRSNSLYENTVSIESSESSKSGNEHYDKAMHILESNTIEDAQYKQALVLLGKAADEGFIPAFNDLGLMYLKGEGVEVDENTAFIYFQKAADGGDTNAMINLGSCYEEGLGVEKDSFIAVDYYKSAAMQGNPQAQLILGDCYWDRTLRQEALEWYEKSAKQGNYEALLRLLDQIEEKEKKKEWTNEFYENGSEESLYNIAEYYRYCQGDYIGEAIAFYKKSAEKGFVKAMLPLGQLLFELEGDNNKQSEEWFDKVSASGNVELCMELVAFYENNHLEDKAYELLKKIADSGNPTAQLNYGKVLYNDMKCNESLFDVGRKQDAARYFLQAARQDVAEAMYYYALCLEYGKGIPKDLNQALLWHKKAAALGYKDSEKRVQSIEHWQLPWYKKILKDLSSTE